MKKARAERILAMRAAGATQEQVARALDCSVETIRRTERWAEQNGLLEEAQFRFAKMLNKATKVYERRLDDDSNNPKLALEAARDVAFGTGALRKQHPTTNPAVEEESLTLILKRRRERLAQQADQESGDEAGSPQIAPDPSSALAEDVVEGVVEGSFRVGQDGIELA